MTVPRRAPHAGWREEQALPSIPRRRSAGHSPAPRRRRRSGLHAHRVDRRDRRPAHRRRGDLRRADLHLWTSEPDERSHRGLQRRARQLVNIQQGRTERPGGRDDDHSCLRIDGTAAPRPAIGPERDDHDVRDRRLLRDGRDRHHDLLDPERLHFWSVGHSHEHAHRSRTTSAAQPSPSTRLDSATRQTRAGRRHKVSSGSPSTSSPQGAGTPTLSADFRVRARRPVPQHRSRRTGTSRGATSPTRERARMPVSSVSPTSRAI